MDFEKFKESFVEDVKQQLYENGVEANVSTNEVSKLNEPYEAGSMSIPWTQKVELFLPA